MKKVISTVDTLRNMSDKELMDFIKKIHEIGYVQGDRGQCCDYLEAIKILLTRA